MEKEKWKVRPGAVVSNVKAQDSFLNKNKNQIRSSTEDEVEYYGGYLVCESIASPEIGVILASALEMREMLNMYLNAIEGQEPDKNGNYTQTFGPAMLEETRRILNKKYNE